VLIGREEETARIDRVLADAREGRSSALVIVGDAGIGKTSLLEYAVAQASDLRVLRALGVESEAELEFSGLLELCRPLLGLVQELPPRHAEALQAALGLTTAEGGDRFAIGAATLGLFAAAAEESPLLVAVDDAHWIDDASGDAVGFAIRRLAADRVGFLLTARRESARMFDVPGIELLELEGLDRDAAAGLVEGAAPAVVERLYEASGGNPLALLEIASLLPPAQLEGREPLNEPLPAGAGVERAFARRVAELTGEAQSALLVAAASPSGRLDAIVGALHELGLDSCDLEPGEDAGLLRIGDGRVEMAHPLARSAVYHRAAPSERRRVHRAHATALPEHAAYEERAWHLAAAAVGPNEEVAATLELAAGVSRRRAGHASSSLALERAARLTPDAETRARRFYRAADAAWQAGQSTRALELLHEALELATQTSLRADILHLRGYVEHFVGDVMAAHDVLLAAADLVEQSDPVRAAAILTDAVESCLYGGDASRQLAAALGARELAPRDGGREDFLADMYVGEALMMSGRAAEAAPIYERGLAAYDASEALQRDPGASAVTAFALCWLERSTAARDVARRAVASAREQQTIGGLPYALFALGWAERRLGAWNEATASSSEAVSLARETSQSTLLCECLVDLGTIAAARGQEEDAARYLDEAAALARAHGLGYFEVLLEAPLGVLELGLGRYEQAADRLERLRRRLEDLGMHMIEFPMPDLVEALVRLGRADEAARAVEYVRPDVSPHCASALAERCRGLVATDEEFEHHFTASLELHPDAEDPFARARTALLFGERLRRAGRRVEAREQLRSALAVFERLGAEPWSERARSELRASGQTLRRRAEATEELTPQELQIALQVAEGKSNKEVGAALFLSHKTVEFHLGRIYRKLDISSRGELIRRFSAQPAEAA
jgi:DNA-binding CsgD family transcriptional regulator